MMKEHDGAACSLCDPSTVSVEFANIFTREGERSAKLPETMARRSDHTRLALSRISMEKYPVIGSGSSRRQQPGVE